MVYSSESRGGDDQRGKASQWVPSSRGVLRNAYQSVHPYLCRVRMNEGDALETGEKTKEERVRNSSLRRHRRGKKSVGVGNVETKRNP